MRFLYIAAIRLPTEKAHGVQIMKTCEALAKAGSSVELVVPGRHTHITEDPFNYYKVDRLFPVQKLVVPDWFSAGSVGFALASILFGFKCARYAKRTKAEAVYSRDKFALLAVAFFAPKLKLAWELHGKESAWAVGYFKKRAKFVVITQGIKDELVLLGVPEAKVCAAPDGVDLEPFKNPETKEVARARLNLPDKKIAMYIGRLDGWKGVDTLLEASLLLPEDVAVAIIGGEPAQVERLQKQYPNALFLGYHPYAQVADNEAAADVLVLPNTAKDVTSEKYTSPLKLFTYMAGGKPIVASDLPSIREVLDDSSAFFVEPDNAEALANGISAALSNHEQSEVVAKNARMRADKYTWNSRAASIFTFLSK